MKRFAILLLVVLAGGNAIPARAAEPVFTNKPRFRIPFKFDTAEMQRLQPREVQLHVSNDRGARWQHLLSANPNAGKFDFEAPGDGEYWFGVKTLDSQNRLYPRENTEPGLKVIVDTTLPTLELSLVEVERGKVKLTWYADDAHLDLTTLRLEYMQTGSNSWQQVSIIPQGQGQTTWSVPAVDASRCVEPSATRHRTWARQKHRSMSVPRRAAIPIRTKARKCIASRSQTGSRPTIRSVQCPASTRIHRIRPRLSSRVRRVSRQSRTCCSRAPRAPGARTDGKYISDVPASRPQVLQQRTAPGGPAPQPAAPQVPAAVQHFVNNRSFQVGYRIDGADSASVAAVELYWTTDNGAQWSQYGDDEDRTSPFPVSVPEDGVYGFRLRVRSATGPSIEPPKPGEEPSIVVTVDQTPPVAQLLPVQPGAGATQSDLLIRWDVRDAHLGPTPIALSVGATPAGPWKSIGGWQPNSGQFVWTPEPNMPATTYLRLTAKDAAGNVTEIAPREAVILLNAPRTPVRIIGVDPRSNSKQ